jgi:hypothetical protein
MSQPQPRPAPRRECPLEGLTDHLGCSLKTVYNYVGKGYFPVYRRPGVRGHFVYLDEVDAGMAKIPFRKAFAGHRAFGPQARIIDLPPLAVVVGGDAQ